MGLFFILGRTSSFCHCSQEWRKYMWEWGWLVFNGNFSEMFRIIHGAWLLKLFNSQNLGIIERVWIKSDDLARIFYFYPVWRECIWKKFLKISTTKFLISFTLKNCNFNLNNCYWRYKLWIHIKCLVARWLGLSARTHADTYSVGSRTFMLSFNNNIHPSISVITAASFTQNVYILLLHFFSPLSLNKSRVVNICNIQCKTSSGVLKQKQLNELMNEFEWMTSSGASLTIRDFFSE